MGDAAMTERLAAAKFVSLTTFKRNGDGVATPMWVGRDGDQLLIWTPADSWKVKRVRRDPRVRLVPCNRTGKTEPGAVPADGTAVVVDDAAEVAAVADNLKRKYGMAFRVITAIEALVKRGRQTRVALRISLTG